MDGSAVLVVVVVVGWGRGGGGPLVLKYDAVALGGMVLDGSMVVAVGMTASTT